MTAKSPPERCGRQEENPSAVRIALHPILQGFQLGGRKVFLASMPRPHAKSACPAHAEIRAAPPSHGWCGRYQLCTRELKDGARSRRLHRRQGRNEKAKQCEVYHELERAAWLRIETLKIWTSRRSSEPHLHPGRSRPVRVAPDQARQHFRFQFQTHSDSSVRRSSAAVAAAIKNHRTHG